MIEIPINPIAFLNIRWYGIMVALAIMVIVLWMLREVKRGANLSRDTVFMVSVVGIPSGVVISKLLHVIDNIVVAKLHPELALSGNVIDYTQYPQLIFTGAGLTIYGAVLGAALGIWIYSKFSNFKFGYFADFVAPGVVLAQVIGRVGCTINGCCYGIKTSLPWGVVYTHPDSIAFGAGVVHPTQVYEFIFCLILFAVLLKIRGRLKAEGSLFLIYLSLFSLWRIGIDFLRTGTPFLFDLHMAQVLGIVILAIAIPLLILRMRRVEASE